MIEDVSLIKVRIKRVQDLQKSYTDQKRGNLEFKMSDIVFK